MTVVFTVDITPWTLVTLTLGALFGAWVKRPVYVVFATLATVFSVYASSALWSVPYSVFHFVAWMLAIFFATAALSNVFAVLIRRVEEQMRLIAMRLQAMEETCHGD